MGSKCKQAGDYAADQPEYITVNKSNNISCMKLQDVCAASGFQSSFEKNEIPNFSNAVEKAFL